MKRLPNSRLARLAARTVVPVALAVPLATPNAALADEVPSDLPRLVLDPGRVVIPPAEPGVLRFEVHGEEQLRLEGLRSFPLEPTASAIEAAKPATLTGYSIGQNVFLARWLRLTPIFQVTDKLTFVGQIDLTGLLAGQTTHDVGLDRTPRNDVSNGYSNVQPRWLYVDWLTPVGLLRAGQMPSHWGMGIVANDGDHPSLFGDYRYGNIVEQVLFATKPLGEKSPFVVAVGGQLVFRDNVAVLAQGDRAWQGVLAAFYEQGPDMVGVYGVYRNQKHDQSSEAYYPYTEKLEVGVVDAAGHFARPIALPDQTAYVFGGFEGAVEFGTTDQERTVYTGQTTVQAYGGALDVGVVLADRDAGAPPAPRKDAARPDLWGKLVAQLEVGYASGDANPNDGTEKRFVFDPNHKVGLLLFDEITRWQTARAAAAAVDPSLTNALRPAPGTNLLPTNGGVFGAQYLYPTAVYRPRPWLDLKAGAVIAQSTADVVDPVRLVTQGGYTNDQGGNPRRHDLGVELDGGVEGRFDIGPGLRLQLGAQGGVLFPGGALADASGSAIRTPWIAIGRVGVLF